MQSFYAPDTLRECPYDANHKIRASKWIEHVTRCKKTNADKAKDFESCPFNASHIMHKNYLLDHLNTCPNKLEFEAQNQRKTYGHGDLSETKNTRETSRDKHTSTREDWND